MGNVSTDSYSSEGLLTEVDLPYDTSVSDSSPLYVAPASMYYSYDTADDLTSYTNERDNLSVYDYILTI